MSDQKLATAITRLEQVTARLEALETFTKNANRQSGEAPPKNNITVSAPISNAGSTITNTSSTSSTNTSANLSEYDQWIATSVDSFVKLCLAIGDDVAEISEFMVRAIAEQRLYLSMSTRCQKPSDKELRELIMPQNKCILDASAFRDKKNRTNFRDHLSAMNEFMPCIGWILQDKPVGYINEVRDSSIFWSNKVLKKYRDADETHVAWCRALTKMCNDLSAYVKKFYMTGVKWNASGPSASSSQLKQKPSTPKKPTVAPNAPPCVPPPVGPPPPGDFVPNATKKPSTSNAGALFAEINGLGSSNITSHLKKVERDPVTGKRIKHKEGVSKSNLDVKPLTTSTKTSNFGASKPVKPPRFEKVGGKKWFIEYQKDVHDLIIEDAMKQQTIYLFKCEKTDLVVHGKCNSIILDNCKKTNVVFDNAVSGVEIINCQSVKVQVMGTVPNVQVDKTDGFHMYLSEDSKNCQFITAKSSEMNISMVSADGDPTEVPIPEQFRTVWNDRTKRFVTEPTELCG